MLKKISFYRLTNNELLTLCLRILLTVGAAVSINKEMVAKILGLVKEYYDKLLPIVNRSLKTVHADILKALDRKRDDAFRAIRDAVLANSRRLNDNCRNHAALLMEIFTRNGWDLWKDNYQVESAELNHLFTELDGKDAQQALTALNLLDWYTELKTAQNDFEAAFQSKANDMSRADFVAIREIRPLLVENLADLLKQIGLESKHASNPTDYKELVNALNTIIAETSSLVKSRITRDNDEEDLPLDDTTENGTIKK